MSSTQKVVVLVVEDDELWRTNLSVTLSQYGKMMVYTAPDAHSALALLQLHPEIRIVVTDNHLGPGLSGIEMIKQLQDRPAWAKLSFVLHHGDCEATLRLELGLIPQLRFVSKVRPKSIDLILAIDDLTPPELNGRATF